MAGGAGLQRGTGEGAGGVGRGSGTSLGKSGRQAPGPDHQMVVACAFKPRFQLPSQGTWLRAAVTAAIGVDEEGQVT